LPARRRVVLLALVLLAAAVVAVARAATPAPPAQFSDALVVSVTAPTAFAFAPDGRILITTQGGDLDVFSGGSLVSPAALSLAGVVCNGEEQGLLGVAVDPAFTGNGFVYLYYTNDRDGTCENRVSRFTMSGNTVDPASELVLVDRIPSPSGTHNGGDLHFGKDGYLYVSVGDGGCDYKGDSGCGGSNDAARDQNALVGKILRITSTGGIPPTNPFQGTGTVRCNTGTGPVGNKCQETFAWGLRNPFRIAFDPNAAGTRLFIDDTGQNDWEEIDEGTAGADYGWSVREGRCANGSTTNCGARPAGMTNPIYDYEHDGCTNAITGGAFVPNGVWPSAYDGAYIFADYVCEQLFTLKKSGSTYSATSFATGVGPAVHLAFGPFGSTQALYYTTYTGGGQIRRIAYTGTVNRAPTAVISANPTSGPAPLDVAFDGSGSSDPDAGDTLTYSWDFGDGSAVVQSSTPTTTHRYPASGTFTATLVVRDTHGLASQPVTKRIDAGNTPPEPSIDSPAPSFRFRVGQTITLTGSATDAEDGAEPGSRLSWTVIRHHATHTHPYFPPTTGASVAFTAPEPEDVAAAANSYLEVQLTATDSRGLSKTISANLLPATANVTLATSPAGLALTVNDLAPPASTFVSWQGWNLKLSAADQTDGNGKPWVFSSWSDGGARTHTITTPATDSSYTATFTSPAAPAGLVAAYAFDEGSGTTTADASGRGNTGTLSNAAWTSAGHTAKALSFNGSSSAVVVPDSSSLDLATGLTVEAWVRPASVSGWRAIAMKERPGGIVYALYGSQNGGLPVGQVYLGSERSTTGTKLATNTWTHVALTWDGATMRLYQNGTQTGSTAVTGTLAASTGALRLGGNSIWGEWFSGQLDDVRVYDRALTQAQVQTDMNTPVGSAGPPPPPPDTQPPTAPGTPNAAPSAGQVALSWTASVDNVGVVRYDVHRSTTPGFTPSAANRIAQPAGTTYVDTGLAQGTYYYRVVAEDAAGNPSASSGEVAAAVPDSTPPTVSVSSPTAGATVSGTVSLGASASDTGGVAGVKFTVDGVDVGAEDTTSPYTGSWDTTQATNGQHVVRAVARDAAGNSATSAGVTVTVSNVPASTEGLVAAYAFDEGTGTSTVDASGKGNTGTLSNATWTTAGHSGNALSFNGTSSAVVVPDSSSLDLTTRMTMEAWVRPASTAGWRTVAMKEATGGIVYALYASQSSGVPVGQVSLNGERSATGASALPLNAWNHVAVTWDGSTLLLYVNGQPAGSTSAPGTLASSTGALRIGGNSIWGEWFSGQLDDVRVYDRALTQGEVRTDMSTPVGGAGPPPPDTQPPTAPGTPTATASGANVSLSWAAATDNVGVTRYRVHRSTTGGFTPSAANQIGTATGTTFADNGLAPATYRYKIVAEDAAGNAGPASGEGAATVQQQTPAGLVAAYAFNEGSGTAVNDASGKNNRGTTSGGTTWTTGGRNGGAMTFNGTNAMVTVADSASLDLTTGLTIEAWVRAADTSAVWSTIALKERPNGMCYGLYAKTSSSGPSLQVRTGGSEPRTPNVAVPGANTWVHVAATYDGSTLRMYVNGGQVAGANATGAVTTSNSALRIGGNSVWGEYLSGSLDDLRIYNRALTAVEIGADMNAPVG